MNLSYIGQVQEIIPIPNADKIESIIVVCGAGGRWQGTAQKNQFKPEDLCFVFLQDAILPETTEFEFMRKHHFRVRMCRFLGVPSEVLITPVFIDINDQTVGTEISEFLGIKKYEKEIPANLTGETKGSFPSFIKKTDEINFQREPELVQKLIGKRYYSSIKYDGTSATFYHYKGEVGVCGRNWEKKLTSDDVYNQINRRYNITDQLLEFGENIAIQGEIVGPGIQKNCLNLKKADLRVFNIFDIDAQKYLPFKDLLKITDSLSIPRVDFIDVNLIWALNDFEEIRKLANVRYEESGKKAEGIVVRNIDSTISFKVINLEYKN